MDLQTFSKIAVPALLVMNLGMMVEFRVVSNSSFAIHDYQIKMLEGIVKPYYEHKTDTKRLNERLKDLDERLKDLDERLKMHNAFMRHERNVAKIKDGDLQTNKPIEKETMLGATD